jgi:hypothetical protein
MPSCPDFWWENPSILLTDWKEFFPFTDRDTACTAAGLNSFTRAGIYIGILLAILRMDLTWLLVGVFFAAFAYGAGVYMTSTGAVREGYSSYYDTYDAVETDAPIVDVSGVDGSYVPDVIGVKGLTDPTAPNPFMNVLMSEISSNPMRGPAAYTQAPKVQGELDTYFETMFYADPGDAFGHTQSQRQFVAMPSTTIPNDQGSYQNWLYRTPGQSCKEGNLAACNFDTGDAAMPWREMRRST